MALAATAEGWTKWTMMDFMDGGAGAAEALVLSVNVSCRTRGILSDKSDKSDMSDMSDPPSAAAGGNRTADRCQRRICFWGSPEGCAPPPLVPQHRRGTTWQRHLAARQAAHAVICAKRRHQTPLLAAPRGSWLIGLIGLIGLIRQSQPKSPVLPTGCPRRYLRRRRHQAPLLAAPRGSWLIGLIGLIGLIRQPQPMAPVLPTGAHAIICFWGAPRPLWLVLRSLYFMLKSADLFAKICQSEFSGRYDTFCNTQKRNITILSYCRIFRKLVR